MSGGGRRDFASSVQPSTRSDSSPRRVANGAPVDPDEVAEVEADQLLEGLFAEQVRARVQLDLAAAVDEVEERRLAVAAARGQPPREPVGVLGLIAGLEALVAGQHLGDRRVIPEARRERIHAGLAKLVELLPPLGEQAIFVVRVVRRPIGGLHAGEGYRGVRRAPGRQRRARIAGEALRPRAFTNCGQVKERVQGVSRWPGRSVRLWG